MGKITETIWEMEPHTEAKHIILRKYLDAWLPILTRWAGRVLYIDGFAGPGEYIGGNPGSPIVAINAILEHKVNLRSEIKMKFIEEREDRCEFLKQKIKEINIPKNIKIDCICDKFHVVMNKILSNLNKENLELAPSFVFIDPFGFKDIPLNTIRGIMKNSKCEVLITLMYEEINRFIDNPQNEEELIYAFGTDEWKKIPKNGPKERMKFIHDLYKRQLNNVAGIEFVQSFKMVNKKNKTDYFLFFGSNDLKGLKVMKAAMWKVDEKGAFEFSDYTYNPFQPYLFKIEPDYRLLKKLILKKYKGKIVPVPELEKFILVETPFRESHYKKQILIPMENSVPPRIEVKSMVKRRKNTYPDHCLIKFL